MSKHLVYFGLSWEEDLPSWESQVPETYKSLKENVEDKRLTVSEGRSD